MDTFASLTDKDAAGVGAGTGALAEGALTVKGLKSSTLAWVEPVAGASFEPSTSF